MPRNFGGKVDEWRAWKQDFQGYLEGENVGLGNFLQKVGDEAEFPNETWWQTQEKEFGTAVTEDGKEVWRTLKELTEGEAQSIVLTMVAGEGFKAWHRLVKHYEPSLAATVGRALSDLTNLGQKRATSPAETRQMRMVMDAKVKFAEDLSGASLDDRHLTSILLGIVDVTTRAHTVAHQGGNFAFSDAKCCSSATATCPRPPRRLEAEDHNRWRWMAWTRCRTSRRSQPSGRPAGTRMTP